MMNSVNKRKILFVHDGPLYQDGNGFFYGLHYNNKLVERYTALGSEVCFMTRISELPAQKEQFSVIDHPAFMACEFPNLKTLKSRLSKKGLARKIAEKAVLESDVVVARLPSSSGSLAVEYAQKHKKPLMVEFVACGWDAYWNYNWKGKLVAPYFFIRQRMRMLKVPYVIYVTKEFLQNRYPTRGKTAGISDVELPNSSIDVLERRISRINNRKNGDVTVLGTIGALDVPYKGQADVIWAIHQLKCKGVIVHYKLVGQGDPSVLNKLIVKLNLESQVSILGALPHQQIFDFLDQIDVYIQPSKTEGLPRAVIEAMSRGCLLMGSAVGGMPELIAPRFIFKSGNSEEIELLIESLNRDTFLKTAYGNYSSASAYSRENMERKRAVFYEEFLANHQLKAPKSKA